VEAQRWRKGSQRWCGRSAQLGIKSGAWSRRLQRVLTDFGAERSFAQAAAQFQEHYGWAVSSSRLRRVTLFHAGQLAAAEPVTTAILPKRGTAQIITSADGTMLPVVDTDGPGPDRRRQRRVRWQEMTLLAARRQGEVSCQYQACQGDTERRTRYWGRAVAASGWGQNSHIHVVADGAPWIAQHSRQLFGKQGSFLLDFYHVSEYLAAAFPKPEQLHLQQRRLRANRSHLVIADLTARAEPATVPDALAPARVALGYLQSRRDQLDYHGALARELPIGSGLIESGHRHVLHARLKLAGAWWSPQHLHNMAQLRTTRANHHWLLYWKKLARN
jgi:hypothetical protein